MKSAVKSRRAERAAPAAVAVPASRFVKLDEHGKELPFEAKKPAAYRHIATGKLLHIIKCDIHQREAEKKAAAVRVFDRQDWQLAELPELELMRDLTRFKPACDPIFDGVIKPYDWAWSRTPGASDPSGCAWYLSFSYGGSYVGSRGSLNGFVVAVAPAGQ